MAWWRASERAMRAVIVDELFEVGEEGHLLVVRSRGIGRLSGTRFHRSEVACPTRPAGAGAELFILLNGRAHASRERCEQPPSALRRRSRSLRSQIRRDRQHILNGEIGHRRFHELRCRTSACALLDVIELAHDVAG
jgi:hypothetical protein